MSALKLTPTEAKQERLDTFCRILTKVDRTITGRTVKCVRFEEPEDWTGHKLKKAPAYSDGETIYFNIDKIGDLSTPEEVVILNGLNYHELCHVLYTPRNHPAISRLRREGKFDAFNALEDQRIESMFVSLYPGTKPYFRLTAMKHLLSNPKKISGMLPLIWGRRYLGADIRNTVAQAYDNQQNLSQIKDVIDEFRGLVLPRDMDDAERLSRRFHDLTGSQDQDQKPSDPFGHDQNRPDMKKGSPESAREQTATQEFREDDDEEQEAEDQEAQEDEEQEEEQEGQESGEGESEDTDAEDEDGEGDSDDDAEDDGEDDDADDADGEGDTSNPGTGDLDSDDETGDAEGNGSTGGDGGDSEDGDNEGGEGESKANRGGGEGAGGEGESKRNDIDLDALKKDLQDGIENIMQSTDVQDDAHQKLRTLQKGDDNMEGAFKRADFSKTPLEPSDRNISGKVAKQFQNLVRDLDPGFHTHKSSGRVNMGRAMRGDDIDTVFDQWDEGKFDASDIELVIGLDMSSSMGSSMEGASRALWVILSAVRSLGNTVSAQAIGFESETSVLYGPNDVIERDGYRYFPPMGGTVANDMVSHAKRIFRKSRKAHKIFITISDGDWNTPDKPEKDIEAMNAAGIHTGAFFLDPRGSFRDRVSHYEARGDKSSLDQLTKRYRHNATTFTVGTSPSDTIPFISNIVKTAMRSK